MTPEAFAAALAALRGDDPAPLAVAVSGGADSLALLLIAHAALGDGVAALTVDHGLRDGSADEAAMVAAVCAARGVRHATLRWEGRKPDANRQAAARAARYTLLRDWCAGNGFAWLATAHHADDQAETLLLRLARGSGNGGLSGIRARRDLGHGVTLLRPLLGVRRAALARIVAAAGLTPVDDPANRDARFDRTRARALLAATPWLDAARLAAAAAHLAEAEAALDWAADLAWASRAVASGATVAIDAAGLPANLRRRLAARALAHLGATADGPGVDRLLARLDGGGTATLGPVQAAARGGWHFRRVGTRVLKPAPKRR